MKKKIKLTPVSTLHYIRLLYRSAIFVTLLVAYILYRVKDGVDITTRLEEYPFAIVLTWLVFVVEMVLRFFPSKLESPGCQKQFSRNYIKTGKTDIEIQDNNGTALVLIIWILFNMVFGFLNMKGILDDGIMILLCSAYSVCDMICILFFCPFQSWFMKNKCCSSCRIYNWDYAMIFTPMFFVRKTYSWTLLAMSIILMLRWEITFYLHPERFSPVTNGYLHCGNCTEKLCAHKRQLHSLWKEIEQYTARRLKRLRGTHE